MVFQLSELIAARRRPARRFAGTNQRNNHGPYGRFFTSSRASSSIQRILGSHSHLSVKRSMNVLRSVLAASGILIRYATAGSERVPYCFGCGRAYRNFRPRLTAPGAPERWSVLSKMWLSSRKLG
jgi:hypothetical protein